jgi:copper oxidase (laccase) domain-containing protein
MDVIVAISKAEDGNMLIATDKSNRGVIENRKKFLTANGININQTTRVSIIYEGNNYLRYCQVDDNHKGKGMFDGDIQACDAIVTITPNHALFLPIADCIRAVLFDPKKQVLMLSHLGRHSLEQNGGYESVKFLIDNYKCNPADLKVWLTPAPGLKSYPMHAFDNHSMKSVTYEQLDAAGISQKNITDDKTDTSESLDYFSHSEFLKGNRPTDGRYAMVAMMR